MTTELLVQGRGGPSPRKGSLCVQWTSQFRRGDPASLKKMRNLDRPAGFNETSPTFRTRDKTKDRDPQRSHAQQGSERSCGEQELRAPGREQHGGKMRQNITGSWYCNRHSLCVAAGSIPPVQPSLVLTISVPGSPFRLSSETHVLRASAPCWRRSSPDG
jgi:hypothetical protein